MREYHITVRKGSRDPSLDKTAKNSLSTDSMLHCRGKQGQEFLYYNFLTTDLKKNFLFRELLKEKTTHTYTQRKREKGRERESSSKMAEVNIEKNKIILKF